MTARAGSLRLELGGLGFRVWCASAPVLADLEPPYLPFVSTAVTDPGPDVVSRSADRGAEIEMEVRVAPVPGFDDASPLFETGRAWTMRTRQDTRIVAQRSLAGDSPLWAASFALGVPHVTSWSDLEGTTASAADSGVSCLLRYPLDQILLMYALIPAGGLLLHATGVVVEGRALVCCGVSGAGKSTLARQFLAAGVGDLLSDDRVVVRPAGEAPTASGPAASGLAAGGLHAFGTPWPGDARIAVNDHAPFGALVFLRHGTANRVSELSPADALHRLLQVASIPWFDAPVMSESLGVCEAIVGAVRAYELEFRPEPAAAECLAAFAASSGPT
jgi:hypothetical protein